MKITLLALALIILSSVVFAKTLVSGNTIDYPGGSQVFPANTPYIDTGAEVILIDADDETKSTFNNSIKATEKGISNGKCAWTDGSFLAGYGIAGNIQDQTWSSWGGGKPTIVVFDLKDEYPISQVDVYSLCSEHLYTEKVELELSHDGETYFPRGTTPNIIKRDKEQKLGVISPIIMPPLKARFVKLIIHPTTMWQQQIGEIAIWADMETKTTGELKTEAINFKARPMGFGAIYFDMKEAKKLNLPVKEYNVYYSENEFTSVDQATKFGTFPTTLRGLSLYPLVPGKSYYVTVTANYETGENKEANIVKITIPKNYEAKTFNDMLAINHYPSGGGAHVPREFESSWDIVSMELMADIPFREHRWWYANSDWIKRFYERGVSLYKESGYSENLEYYRMHLPYGIYPICHGNEPEFNIKPIDDFNDLKKMYEAAKSVDPNLIVCAPVAGTEGSSLEWVDQWYSYGAKDYFDCYDVHPYTKIGGHENLPNCPPGSPEQLLLDIPKLRAIMKKYGDENKPIIASEWGYASIGYNNVSGNINPLVQAQYLTRGLVLHNVLGLARVYIYSFFDEGLDPYNTEHHYGMVDYMGQKKPSYFAIQNLCNNIGEMSYKSEMKGASTPVFGYTFSDGKETATVVWNASLNQKATFKCSDKEVTIIDMLGEKTRKIQVVNGKFTQDIGPSLVIIKHTSPIEFVGGKDLPVFDNTVQTNVENNTLYLKNNSKATITVSVENRYDENINGVLSVLDGENELVSKPWNLSNGKSDKIVLEWTNKNPNAEVKKLTIKNSFVGNDQTQNNTVDIWVRNVSSAVDLYAKEYEGYTIIGNESCEALISTDFGGRICDFIDKKSMTNQIRMNYAELHRLDQLFWSYAIWDELSIYGLNKDGNMGWEGNFKSTKMDSEVKKGKELKLNLSASTNDIDYTKTISLSKNSKSLVTDFLISNKSATEQKVRYGTHPEFTVGGVAESDNDVMYFETEKGKVELPIKLSEGEKSHDVITAPYAYITDQKNKITLREDFDMNFIGNIGLWWDATFYNIGLSGKEINIAPGESFTSTIKYSIL